MENIFRKTLKREVAMTALAVWAVITLWLFFGVEPNHLTYYHTIYFNITWTIWTFAAGAFGAQVFQNIIASNKYYSGN